MEGLRSIPDLNEDDMPGGMAKEAVLQHHDEELKKKVQSSKKMKNVEHNNFREVQEYLKGKSIENTRMAFKIRCEMVEDVRGNFKDKYKKKGGEEALQCQDCDCGQVQTQSHCLVCPRWEDIRTDLKLDQIDDLVKFFQRLLMERLKVKKKTGSATELHKKTPLSVGES